MGGGGSQSSQSQSNLATLSPVAAGLGNLFGQSIGIGRGGGVTTTGTPSFILPQVFNQNSFRDLGSLTTPNNPVQYDLGQFGGAGQGALGTLSEAANTGLIGPATDLFNQLMKQQTAGLQEQFGQFGISPQSSDFQAAFLRNAMQGSTQLADLAQQRRLQAASALPDFMTNLLGTEQAARQAAIGRTPGGTEFNLLQALAGVNTQAGSTSTSKGSESHVQIL